MYKISSDTDPSSHKQQLLQSDRSPLLALSIGYLPTCIERQRPTHTSSLESSYWKLYQPFAFATCALPNPVEFPQLRAGSSSRLYVLLLVIYRAAVDNHFSPGERSGFFYQSSRLFSDSHYCRSVLVHTHV